MDPFHAEAAGALDAQRTALAEAVVALQYEVQPELMVRYGPTGRLRRPEALRDSDSVVKFTSIGAGGLPVSTRY